MTDIVERLRNRALATEIIKGSPALYNDAADVIISLCAENEKLREALKPFAEKYTVKDDNLPNEHNALTLINVGDLRAARKALGETDD
jgi:hypothetical protein